MGSCAIAKFEHPGNMIVNENSGKCLDVTGGSNANGTKVQQWGCWNRPQQRWWLSGISGPAPGVVSGTTTVG